MALRKISDLARMLDVQTLHLTATLGAVVLAAVSVLVLSGCMPSQATNKSVGMPNPASVHCTKQGGRLEIRKGPDGEAGWCHLPDGRVVDEWELYRSQSQSN